jgi:hypothetical protein
MSCVDFFLRQAKEIMDAAESAAGRGETCSQMTILVSPHDGIRMIADSDWSLEALTRHHGAATGYRVTARQGSVQVEGRTGLRSCLLKSTPPARVPRLLLGSR